MRKLVVPIMVAAATFAIATSALATGRQITCYGAQATTYCPFWGANYSGMRFQTNIEQSRIRYAGDINEVEFYNTTGAPGRFNNFVVHLCHTDRVSLSTTFGVNYYGTPVQMVSLSAFNIPASRGWFGFRMVRRFTYDNVRHLLIEIRWEGDNGVNVPVYVTNELAANRRVWALNNPNAPTGTADGRAYYTRLSFRAYVACEPTSLGRVKALYN